PQVLKAVRSHPLHEILLEDPHVHRAFTKPRGYAGDAKLIDLIYRRQPHPATSPVGKELFSFTTGFQASEGVRQRRDYAEKELMHAHAEGRRILSLACGHFREGERLIGYPANNITVVDQDALSLNVVRKNHGTHLNIV